MGGSTQRRMVKLKKKMEMEVRIVGREGLTAERGCHVGLMRLQEDTKIPTSTYMHSSSQLL